MQDRDLYAKLLGLEPPWEVVDVDISTEDHSARWASSGRHVDHRDRRRVMISM